MKRMAEMSNFPAPLRHLMRLFSVALLFLALAVPAQAHTYNSRTLGAGIVLGSPTALTGKYWLDREHAIDFGLGYWYGDYLEIYGDYLWHFSRAFARAQEPFTQFVPYIGVGGDFHVANHTLPYYDNDHPSAGLFVRVPFGIEWLPPRAPIGVFVELAPAIEIIPGIAGAFEGGLGIRYYFY